MSDQKKLLSEEAIRKQIYRAKLREELYIYTSGTRRGMEAKGVPATASLALNYILYYIV